eukprot:TRINITY_DN3913_c0_g1_i1.p1 TRINITY_DN3913_c0_g1~~TRINITY_DN3913_c0_g1_i1.p1  ORF type:complete len:163 (-),score=32.16 TRINITY_DN3913_c0_g1_i1:49-480(-)
MDSVHRDFQQKVDVSVQRVSERLMPAQKHGLQCALRCFDTHPGHKAVGECMQGCQKPFEELGKNVEREIGGLQNSIQSCMQAVHSRLRPKIEAFQQNPSNSESAQKELEAEMVAGGTRCFKEAESSLAEMEGRIEGRIRNAGF